MLFLFPRGLFLFRKVGFRNLALANANISTILFEVRKPTRDITVNIFSFFFFYFRKVFFYFRKVFFISARLFFISARFVLFPQGLLISARFCSFPQGLFYFRKVILFPQGFIYLRKVIFISPRFHRSSSQFGSRQCQYVHVIFPQGFFLFPQGFFFISARLFLFPRFFYYICFIYIRKVISAFVSFPQGYIISAFPARLFLFPRGFIVHLLNLGLANANISTLLFEARHYAKWPGPTRTLVVTIENIFAEIKITLRK